MGALDNFTFGLDYGYERREVDGLDNVLWDDGKICVALFKSRDREEGIRVDFSRTPRDDGAWGRDEYVQLEDDDVLTAKCIALEWINTHGGN